MQKPVIPFEPFPKVPRLFREVTITEKIDGTNAGVYVDDDLNVFASSRTRWITPEDDNFGFAAWAEAHADELRRLGPGMHFGEWWGRGIQRGYGRAERHFSLFNTARWNEDNTPDCCSVVPVLYQGEFSTLAVNGVLDRLEEEGSRAAPGFDSPEGVMIYHTASRQIFKATLEGDQHKG